MDIFKFGGASVKNAAAIKNLTDIVSNYQHKTLVVVISAMGKTTNALEEILNLAYKQKSFKSALEQLIDFHKAIISDLFDTDINSPIREIEALFNEIEGELDKDLHIDTYNVLYDRIISKGELASTKIVQAYFNRVSLKSNWVDARRLIRTDSTFREGRVDWNFTCSRITQQLVPLLEDGIVVTQGFIASDSNENTTTLGREGSDYTAAIFGSCLNADAVTIWKDVDGILNADPKKIKKTIKYAELPYREAAEMTFYGASVIHPKTIKPLANKKIPLWVRPFDNIKASGTCIHDCVVKDLAPSIIFKPNQCLLSFRVKDFTFISERNLSLIFEVLDGLNIKINLMQNSAISFSICVDNQNYKISALIKRLTKHFNIYYNERLELITVKNYTNKQIKEVSTHKRILLEQRTRNNFQIVVPEEAQ